MLSGERSIPGSRGFELNALRISGELRGTVEPEENEDGEALSGARKT